MSTLLLKSLSLHLVGDLLRRKVRTDLHFIFYFLSEAEEKGNDQTSNQASDLTFFEDESNSSYHNQDFHHIHMI